jgi:hypothetical protein
MFLVAAYKILGPKNISFFNSPPKNGSKNTFDWVMPYILVHNIVCSIEKASIGVFKLPLFLLTNEMSLGNK